MKWCRAKAVCPHSGGSRACTSQQHGNPTFPSILNSPGAALFARAMELAPDSLARLVRGPEARRLVSGSGEGATRLRAELRTLISAVFPTVPGSRSEITNAQAAFELAAKHGVSTSAFMDCVKVALCLEGVLREASGPITKSGHHTRRKRRCHQTAKAGLVNTFEQVRALPGRMRHNWKPYPGDW